MKRRDFLQQAALGVAGVTTGLVQTNGNQLIRQGKVGVGQIHFEVHGNPKGKPLFLGFPLFPSYGQIFGEAQAVVLSGFLDRLVDRYRVLLADYPTIGKSGTTPPTELNADRVSADLLSVADAAGFKRFAYWGYAWGAAAGLQLASRTKRLSALVIGGWPPLGGDYAGMLQAARTNLPNPSPGSMAVLRNKEQYQQWVTFYESVQNWPEARANAGFRFPKLVFYGADSVTTTGGVTVGYAATIRDRRRDLEALGWRVREIPGKGHGVGLEPATIVPVVREFLDKAI